MRKKEALSNLASAHTKSFYEFDLRHIYNEKKQKGDPKQYLVRKDIREKYLKLS
jgi:hypothetical protein